MVVGAAASANQPRPAVERPQAVPGFWDPRRRPDRPDMSRLTVIRFLTETDYPPFNFTGADGNPAGFNVDLARALCDEIKISCTVQMRRFETLVDAITSNRGDAIIASMSVTPALRARLDFTDPYYRAPARFVSRRDAVMPEIRPEYLEGKAKSVSSPAPRTGYLKASVHRRRDQVVIPMTTRCASPCGGARSISSSVTRSRWVLDQRHDSGDCCAFSARPFVESAFRRGHRHRRPQGNDLLRTSLNWALFRILGKRPLHRPVLRYFSISPF